MRTNLTACVFSVNSPKAKIRYVPTISDEEALLVVKPLEHYDAYLVAAKREDGLYKALAERLQRKPPEQETTKAEKRKKA
jgi:hypothetical protein